MKVNWTTLHAVTSNFRNSADRQPCAGKVRHLERKLERKSGKCTQHRLRTCHSAVTAVKLLLLCCAVCLASLQSPFCIAFCGESNRLVPLASPFLFQGLALCTPSALPLFLRPALCAVEMTSRSGTAAQPRTLTSETEHTTRPILPLRSHK